MTERLVELLLRAGLIKRFVSLHGAEKDLLSFAIFYTRKRLFREVIYRGKTDRKQIRAGRQELTL